MKIEKAIEILETMTDRECENCPNEGKCFKAGTGLCVRAMNLVKEALEKQTPMKPLQQQLNVNEVLIGLCPVCQKMWCISYKEYCANCGQALKWEDDTND